MVYQRIFSWWKRFDWLWPLSKDYQTNRKAVNILRAFNETVISQRKKQLIAQQQGNNNDSDKTGDEVTPKRRPVFLDMMLSATVDGVPLTDQEIGDEVSTFVFAVRRILNRVMYSLIIYS